MIFSTKFSLELKGLQIFLFSCEPSNKETTWIEIILVLNPKSHRPVYSSAEDMKPSALIAHFLWVSFFYSFLINCLTIYSSATEFCQKAWRTNIIACDRISHFADGDVKASQSLPEQKNKECAFQAFLEDIFTQLIGLSWNPRDSLVIVSTGQLTNRSAD